MNGPATMLPSATRCSLVNDVHSQLNLTHVDQIVRPDSSADVRDAVIEAGRVGLPVCIAGGQHAMGSQQFASNALLLDIRELNRMFRLDSRRGLVEVEAGIQWPALIAKLIEAQRNQSWQWGIA